MKKITFLLLGLLLFTTDMVSAQEELETVYVSAKKADSYTFVDGIRYYYYPNLQAYFDTKEALYIQKQNGVWVKSEKIDQNSRGYSLKNGAYVMIKGYVEDQPYTLIDEHKVAYPADYSTRRQPPKKSNPIASN
jgi:hypothetical protein